MIASLEGILESRMPDYAVISVAGVGFKVHAPTPALAALGEIGQRAKLHTLLYVRQEQLALYGFAAPEDLRLFELLLSVSGVGPKAGLAILSNTAAGQLQVAIATGNVEPLTKIPGVGRKTAERIVLELRGKIGAVQAIPAVDGKSVADGEIVAALTGLGYSSAEANEAVRSLPDEAGASLEERVLAALRHFSTI